MLKKVFEKEMKNFNEFHEKDEARLNKQILNLQKSF